MPESRRYGSLYWRIALGLFASLALMVAAEAGLFIWITQQAAGSMPAQSPRRLAVIVASDLSAALSTDPGLDLERYVREQYARIYQPFLVVMVDGRTFSNHADVPEALQEAVRAELPDPAAEPGDAGPRPRRGMNAADGVAGRRGRGRTGAGRALRPRGGLGGIAPIVRAGTVLGRVAVLPGPPPFVRIVRDLGPTLGVAAAAVLLGGGALIALLVFRPVRARLKHVQTAAEELRSGNLDARAPVDGSDEVAALARAFNEMADELARRTQALQSSDAARRQLLADVSHELMTPLTAMRGYIETLGMPEVRLDEPTRQRYLSVVGEETGRLERLIGDLLDLARLEGGGTNLNRRRVPVPDLLARVAARHERDLDARGIRLATSVAGDARQVTGDGDRLEQALQNLAANALRHTPDGGTITIEVSRVPAGVRIQVRDTGPGIPPEHLPLIFDRFYKADAARKASGGSGLGLSITKAIIEAHGGSIAARNQNGAVFTIVLPEPAPDGRNPSPGVGPVSPAGDDPRA